MMKFLIIPFLLFSVATAQNKIHGKGAIGRQQTAANVNPVSKAGVDKVITLPTNSVTFFGSATDSDGGIASYLWAQVSGVLTLRY